MKKFMLLMMVLFFIGCDAVVSDNKGTIKIFQAWSPVEGKDQLSELEKIACHDLYLDDPWGLRLTWHISDEQPYDGLSEGLDLSNLEEAINRRKTLKDINPDIKIICEVLYREGDYNHAYDGKQSFLPPDSEYWLRDDKGQLIAGYAEDDNGNGHYELEEVRSMLTDFTHPEFQDLVVNRVVSLYESKLYDGVFLDWWHESESTTGSFIDWDDAVLTSQEETKARLEILDKIRSNVDDDFLILVNTNTSKVPKSAPYINGIFMEAYKKDADKNYDQEEILTIEATLSWAENAVREPRINCLEIWSTVNHYTDDDALRMKDRNSKKNVEQNMFFFALLLIQSDGYYNFTDDGRLPSDDHLHNWYDFWHVDLGSPVTGKDELYKQRPGVFIREYDKAYVVYNRSGKEQIIEFDEKLLNLFTDKKSQDHTLMNLSSAIFLKND